MKSITLANFLNFKGALQPSMEVEIGGDLKGLDGLDGEKQKILMPAIIDPHVHFRTPGSEHKENWLTGPKAALAGGVTTVFDMPNTRPSTTCLETLRDKKKLIESQLNQLPFKFNYYLYFGASSDNYTNFKEVKKDKQVIGVKLYMGSSTGNLLVHKTHHLENIFKACADSNLILGIHAEKETILIKSSQKDATIHNHTQVRPRKSAIKATQQALDLAHKYHTKIAILHMGTCEEMDLVKQAQKEGVEVAMEVTPNHLFLNDAYYEKLGHKIKMNPPIRSRVDSECLFNGLKNKEIDWIGTDHAPHTLEEKNHPYDKAPPGIPGVQTSLNLMLNECLENRCDLSLLQQVMRENIIRFFQIEPPNDWIILDPNQKTTLKNEKMLSKSGYTPFAGRELRGKICYVISHNQLVDVQKLQNT